MYSSFGFFPRSAFRRGGGALRVWAGFRPTGLFKVESGERFALEYCCKRKEGTMVRSLNAIAAVCQNMGIGKDGQLPWPPLRNEFRYFQKMTKTTTQEGKQNVVIMGKKTWFSIPEDKRPLKDRINIVLSKELKEAPKGAHFLARSLAEALKLLESSELESKTDMVWIVGGSTVYKAAMDEPIHQRLFVTRILCEFESDTFFPEIDLEKYRLLPGYPGVPADIQEENGIQYKFEVYEKII
ncbi:dihydrofolate reductase [Hemicordylus capensis]|uniref:dihydrofolate reductase n=1 Tax=Hemicordylus capensis TaxID=884348 RepID=UPI0023032815|nr:dihydrofolate reductase [Hemicordylus capensis]